MGPYEIAGLFVLVALVAFFKGFLSRRPHGREGWVYFISNGKGPIKIGMSKYDPTAVRLAELQTMSPTPLRVLYKFTVKDRYAAERMVHSHLAAYRQHGEWFDRDVTLAFIEYLKGNY